jgi:hypothetical protein
MEPSTEPPIAHAGDSSTQEPSLPAGLAQRLQHRSHHSPGVIHTNWPHRHYSAAQSTVSWLMRRLELSEQRQSRYGSGILPVRTLPVNTHLRREGSGLSTDLVMKYSVHDSVHDIETEHGNQAAIQHYLPQSATMNQSTVIQKYDNEQNGIVFPAASETQQNPDILTVRSNLKDASSNQPNFPDQIRQDRARQGSDSDVASYQSNSSDPAKQRTGSTAQTVRVSSPANMARSNYSVRSQGPVVQRSPQTTPHPQSHFQPYLSPLNASSELSERSLPIASFGSNYVIERSPLSSTAVASTKPSLIHSNSVPDLVETKPDSIPIAASDQPETNTPRSLRISHQATLKAATIQRQQAAGSSSAARAIHSVPSANQWIQTRSERTIPSSAAHTQTQPLASIDAPEFLQFSPEPIQNSLTSPLPLTITPQPKAGHIARVGDEPEIPVQIGLTPFRGQQRLIERGMIHLPLI